MRKYIIGFSLLFLAGVSQAGIFGYGADKTVLVKYTFPVAASVTSTSTIVIDRSDTTNWPHGIANPISIVAIDIDVDKVAAATTTIKLGVVNHVNASTGSVTWFWARNFGLNVSNADLKITENYYPLRINTKVEVQSGNTDGITPFILSNDTTSGSATYQNDVVLPSASGTDVAPLEGDIVMEVGNDGSNASTIDVHIWYYTDRR